MAITLGASPVTDRCWLAFLTTPRLTHSQRRALLLAGFDPVDPSSSGLAPSEREALATVLAETPVQGIRLWPDWPRSVQLVPLGDPDYPEMLAACSDAPPVLFVVGDSTVLGRMGIAVVGTRNPSADGRRAAHELSADIVKAGFTVVSGLARGVDSAAHLGALQGGGTTIAVMATGMDRIYPAEHARLARDIVNAGGAVVTEFVPGVAPLKGHFPRRNRTISGLTLGTVVVEAGRPSGSLLTATAAAEQGREVFAYPWSVYHRGGEGCRYLLAEGAGLALGAESVILGLRQAMEGWATMTPPAPRLRLQADPTPPDRCALADQAPPTNPLLNHLGDGEVPLARLVELTGEAVGPLLRQLSELELSGAVCCSSAGYRAVRPTRQR